MKQHDSAPFNWREHLPVHPAAELFPLMSEAELKELADDIVKNGLVDPIVIWSPLDPDDERQLLLDGRNRLDALAMAGLLSVDDEGRLRIPQRHTYGDGWFATSATCRYIENSDPFALALSYNIHRRHLTAEQKRELIAKVLEQQPEKSDRQIAGIVKADHKTVGAIRSEKEGRGEIPHVAKRTDSKGRKQPAKKSKPVNPKKTAAKPNNTTVNAETTAKPPASAKGNGITDNPIHYCSFCGNSSEQADIMIAGGTVYICDQCTELAALRVAEHKVASYEAGTAKDTALHGFDSYVLRLLQMIKGARPGKFALTTAVPASDLLQLGSFLNEIAAELPDDTDASAKAMKAKHEALNQKVIDAEHERGNANCPPPMAAEPVAPVVPDDLSIPPFLQRGAAAVP